VAVIFTSIGASIAVLSAKVPSPTLSMGSPSSIYGSEALSVPFNDVSIVGS